MLKFDVNTFFKALVLELQRADFVDEFSSSGHVCDSVDLDKNRENFLRGSQETNVELQLASHQRLVVAKT